MPLRVTSTPYLFNPVPFNHSKMADVYTFEVDAKGEAVNWDREIYIMLDFEGINNFKEHYIYIIRKWPPVES